MVNLEEICALAVAVDRGAKDAVWGWRGIILRACIYDGQSALLTEWVTYFRFLEML